MTLIHRNAYNSIKDLFTVIQNVVDYARNMFFSNFNPGIDCKARV